MNNDNDIQSPTHLTPTLISSAAPPTLTNAPSDRRHHPLNVFQQNKTRIPQDKIDFGSAKHTEGDLGGEPESLHMASALRYESVDLNGSDAEQQNNPDRPNSVMILQFGSGNKNEQGGDMRSHGSFYQSQQLNSSILENHNTSVDHLMINVSEKKSVVHENTKGEGEGVRDEAQVMSSSQFILQAASTKLNSRQESNQNSHSQLQVYKELAVNHSAAVTRSQTPMRMFDRKFNKINLAQINALSKQRAVSPQLLSKAGSSQGGSVASSFNFPGAKPTLGNIISHQKMSNKFKQMKLIMTHLNKNLPKSPLKGNKIKIKSSALNSSIIKSNSSAQDFSDGVTSQIGHELVNNGEKRALSGKNEAREGVQDQNIGGWSHQTQAQQILPAPSNVIKVEKVVPKTDDRNIIIQQCAQIEIIQIDLPDKDRGPDLNVKTEESLRVAAPADAAGTAGDDQIVDGMRSEADNFEVDVSEYFRYEENDEGRGDMTGKHAVAISDHNQSFVYDTNSSVRAAEDAKKSQREMVSSSIHQTVTNPNMDNEQQFQYLISETIESKVNNNTIPTEPEARAIQEISELQEQVPQEQEDISSPFLPLQQTSEQQQSNSISQQSSKLSIQPSIQVTSQQNENQIIIQDPNLGQPDSFDSFLKPSKHKTDVIQAQFDKQITKQHLQLNNKTYQIEMHSQKGQKKSSSNQEGSSQQSVSPMGGGSQNMSIKQSLKIIKFKNRKANYRSSTPGKSNSDSGSISKDCSSSSSSFEQTECHKCEGHGTIEDDDESDDFSPQHNLINENINKTKYFHELQSKKGKKKQRHFRNVVKKSLVEEVINIMHSDEEREKLKNVSLSMNFMKLLIDLKIQEKFEIFQFKCCGRLCFKCCVKPRNQGLSQHARQSLVQMNSVKRTLERQHTWRDLIYSKDETLDLEYEKLLQKGIIKQDHPLRKKWDILIILFSLYNCIELPMEIAFNWRSTHDVYMITERLNNVIDVMFFIDIVMNFRTTYFNPRTGEEIIDKRKILLNYVSGHFIIDLLSTIPFDLIYDTMFSNEKQSANRLQIISAMKIIRILRMSRLITYLNQAEDIKLSLRLMQTIFLIFLYIHITACLWYLIIKQDQSWEPNQSMNQNFREMDFGDKYCISFYTSILALCTNDIYPATLFQYFCSCLILICGALLQATLFGQVASIVQSMSRKSQTFQEKIDLANTSMKNMQLHEKMQQNIRDYMTKTQSNMDNQKEMEQFLKILSPSMRVRVTNHIFEQAILKNPIFCDKMDVVEYIIDYIEPKLFFPEDSIIKMGSQGKLIFFIANGDCQVSISNHLKQPVSVNMLHQGDYFGEIAVLFGTTRSSNIDSLNYCTLAHLSSQYLQKLANICPELYESLKERALETYCDDWIEFKTVLLQQIDYFNQDNILQANPHFFKEIQFYMEELTIQPGTEIIQIGDQCTSLMFVVNGLVEIEVEDNNHNKYLLDTLKQGDLIGQYSVLFGQEIEFNATAKTHCRLLQLPDTFFSYFTQEHCCSTQNKSIDGFGDAIDQAQELVDKFDVPVCDYKIFNKHQVRQDANELYQQELRLRFQRAVKKAMIMAKLTKPKQNNQILLALKQLKDMKMLGCQLNNLNQDGQSVGTDMKQLQIDIEAQIKSNIDKDRDRSTKIDRLQKKVTSEESTPQQAIAHCKSSPDDIMKPVSKVSQPMLQAHKQRPIGLGGRGRRQSIMQQIKQTDNFTAKIQSATSSHQESHPYSGPFRNNLTGKIPKVNLTQPLNYTGECNQGSSQRQQHTAKNKYSSGKISSNELKKSQKDEAKGVSSANDHQKNLFKQKAHSKEEIQLQPIIHQQSQDQKSFQNFNQKTNRSNASGYKKQSSRLPKKNVVRKRERIGLNSNQYASYKQQIQAKIESQIIGGVKNVFNDAENYNNNAAAYSLLGGSKQNRPSKKQQTKLQQMRNEQIINMKQIALKVLVRRHETKQRKQSNKAIKQNKSFQEQMDNKQDQQLQNHNRDSQVKKRSTDIILNRQVDNFTLGCQNAQDQMMQKAEQQNPKAKQNVQILPLIQEELSLNQSQQNSIDSNSSSSESISNYMRSQ